MDRTITQYGPSSSMKVGELPEGCKRCIDGEKIVLYVTGSCSVGCVYCPIPEDRQLIDDIFVNERKVSLDKNGLNTIFEESDLCLSTGSGITGGDPMEVPQRTIDYIKNIRNEFGPDYHLHLYTSGRFFIDNENLIDDLFAAGLDELRFHPRNIKTKVVWDIAKRAKINYPNNSIGFEIPAIPSREDDIEELIIFADRAGLDFVNLNEYEFTETNFNKLSQRGFVSVLTNSAAIGSKETATHVMNNLKDKTTITMHFCSSGSKDSIQLVQRFKRRASQIKREFDFVTEDGLIQFGRIVCEDEIQLNKLVEVLQKEFEVEDDLLQIFKGDLSVETADYILMEIISELRESFPELQGEIVNKHPIDNSPIISIDPL